MFAPIVLFLISLDGPLRVPLPPEASTAIYPAWNCTTYLEVTRPPKRYYASAGILIQFNS